MRVFSFLAIFMGGLAYSATQLPHIKFQFNWQKYLLEVRKESHVTAPQGQSNKWQLRNEVKQETIAKAGAIIERFFVDSDTTVRELIEQNESFSEQYSLFLENIRPDTIQFTGRNVVSTMKIPLRGNKGFISILPLPWETEKYQSLEKVENYPGYYEVTKAESEYVYRGATMTFTGLIIDVREMNFNPSFAPRIYDQQGGLIYGPEFIPAKTGIKRFVAGFSRDIKDKESIKRAGNRPLLTSALALKGEYNTDAVIATEDVRKLFRSKESLQNLRKCRVVFWY